MNSQFLKEWLPMISMKSGIVSSVMSGSAKTRTSKLSFSISIISKNKKKNLFQIIQSYLESLLIFKDSITSSKYSSMISLSTSLLNISSLL